MTDHNEQLEAYIRTAVVPVTNLFTPRCKERIQMSGDKSVKCFGERYHDVWTDGVHAGFVKSGKRNKIIRWTSNYAP